jgi:uncharacterized protein (UPF0333 family)
MKFSIKQLDLAISTLIVVTAIWIFMFLINIHQNTADVKATHDVITYNQNLIISNQQMILSNLGMVITNHYKVVK